jgi:dipeptidyl aminopeptidase/acylaminoacyl peptidase
MIPVIIDFGPDCFKLEDRIITQVTWVDENTSVLVRIMNRIQNKQKLYMVYLDGDSWKSKLLRDEQTKDKAWINLMQPLYFVKATESNPAAYIEMIEDPKGFTHLGFFENVQDKAPKFITSGNWEVTSVDSINPITRKVFYTSTERESTQRHVFSISFEGKDKTSMIPTSIETRPAVVKQQGNELTEIGKDGYYSAKFSPGSTYYQLSYAGPDLPFERLEKVGDISFGDMPKYQHQLNDQLQLHTQFEIPTIKYFTIKNDAGDEMNAKYILPPGFNPKGSKKYPVLMQVYGGPNSQFVTKKYNIDAMHELALLDIIILSVDGRGTGFKGRQFRSVVSEHLGKFEVQDYITAARWAGEQSYVDKSKIGIWGWSFGGYITTKVVEANSDIISLGVAVAPVTDWKYYDTVYTERFMKTLAENPKGYETSAVQKMEGFKNTKFLLIHGTADDNVHFQNAADLIWKLTGAGVYDYSVQVYTDSDHSISTHGARRMLEHKMELFLCKGFDLACGK